MKAALTDRYPGKADVILKLMMRIEILYIADKC